jgi:RNA exonuclease NGL2
MIAFKRNRYTKIEEQNIYYDDQLVHADGDKRQQRGSSFQTRNIGTMVALKNVADEGGAVVATTHLFWHPK